MQFYNYQGAKIPWGGGGGGGGGGWGEGVRGADDVAQVSRRKAYIYIYREMINKKVVALWGWS